MPLEFSFERLMNGLMMLDDDTAPIGAARTQQLNKSIIDQRQAETDSQNEREKQISKMRLDAMGNILENQLKLAGSSEDESVREAAAGNVEKLMGAMGVPIEALELTAQAKQNGSQMKVTDMTSLMKSATPESFEEFAKGNFKDRTVLRSREKSGAQAKNTRLSPQDILVSPSGEVLAENKNAKPQKGNKPTTFDKQMGVFQPKFDAAKKAFEDDPTSMQAMAELAIKNLEFSSLNKTMSPSQSGKQQAEIKSAIRGFKNFDKAANRIEGILESNSDALTAAGKGAVMLRATTENIKGLGSALGMNDFASQVDIKDPALQTKLDRLADNFNISKSALTSLAIQFAVSSGLAKGRMSNQDIEIALDQLGAGDMTPSNMLSKFKEARRQLVDNVSSILEVGVGQFEPDGVDVQLRSEQPQPQTPANTSDVPVINEDFQLSPKVQEILNRNKNL